MGDGHIHQDRGEDTCASRTDIEHAQRGRQGYFLVIIKHSLSILSLQSCCGRGSEPFYTASHQRFGSGTRDKDLNDHDDDDDVCV